MMIFLSQSEDLVFKRYKRFFFIELGVVNDKHNFTRFTNFKTVAKERDDGGRSVTHKSQVRYEERREGEKKNLQLLLVVVVRVRHGEEERRMMEI
ncbi:hypothetical protein MTR_5g023070 [Medicago truncatula]|uniref:Uncharacterized protein n=1 Tax=Medicago truncatula TaxID=3880 RepID=G7JYS2_MEDTR|nr:hypothetical protein MTR_5g023070 [Medicago truncatula]